MRASGSAGRDGAVDVVITIDTEADNQWETGHPIETENLRSIPRFQELCDRYGLKPTYLCTYEVVVDPVFEDTLKCYQDEGRAEVASHLHPWSNPPLPDDAYDLENRPFPSELDDDIFRRKMEVLTDTITRACARAPVSFRAGRWGFKSSHVPILRDLGYLVDCSVTPLTNWSRTRGVRENGPDFRRARAYPYRLDGGDVCVGDRSGLLEVPMTILCTRDRALRLINRIFPEETSLPSRALRKALRLEPQWFRPYPYMSSDDLKAVFDTALAQGLPVVTLMFHSSELMPGGSPYNPSDESIERLYERFEALFAHARAKGGRGATLREFAARYQDN